MAGSIKTIRKTRTSIMKKPSISFFCPAYFDEENLPLLIPKTVETLNKHASKFEIVIIEDNGPDKTALVADKLAKKYKPFVRVIHNPSNMGYGGALSIGYKNANKYDYVFYTDGDNQYDTKEVIRMLPFLKDYEVVVGYRTKRALKLSRQIQTRVFNWLVRLIFGIKVKDINCAMKIISRKALNSISLTSEGGFIDAELLIKLKRKGYAIKEVEVTHYPRRFGKASGGSKKLIIKTIQEMVNFYLESRSNH